VPAAAGWKKWAIRLTSRITVQVDVFLSQVCIPLMVLDRYGFVTPSINPVVLSDLL
jgi:hypothetical protein